VRLSEELARILKPPARRKRRAGGEAPREIVPSERPSARAGDADPFDAARARLKAQIPPPDDDAA
jgi:hypothetical protein